MIIDTWRDHGVDQGLSAVDKTALIDIANAADANQSVVKTNITNALNLVSTDNVLGLTAASTWVEILAKIPQVKTGKKWASGYTPSLTAPDRGSIDHQVSGLGFTPSVIVVVESNATTSGQAALYNTTPNLPFSLLNGFLGGATSSYFRVEVLNVASNAFTIRFNSKSNAFSTTTSAKWIAFE